MSAAETIRMARQNGVRLGVVGTDLILDAAREPAPGVLEALRRHKAGIVALLTAPSGDWSAENWQAFFDERASVAEFDGGLPRPEAEARAFECCIIEWLNHHPCRSDPGGCAWCKRPDGDGRVVIPFGTESHDHTWLHPDCWRDWHQDRCSRAQQTLAAMGLDASPKCVKGAKFPDDFGKSGGT